MTAPAAVCWCGDPADVASEITEPRCSFHFDHSDSFGPDDLADELRDYAFDKANL